MDIADRLKRWRGRAGLKQDQAARVFHVSLQTYRNWEQDRHKPRDYAADDVDAILKLSAAWREEVIVEP